MPSVQEVAHYYETQLRKLQTKLEDYDRLLHQYEKLRRLVSQQCPPPPSISSSLPYIRDNARQSFKTLIAVGHDYQKQLQAQILLLRQENQLLRSERQLAETDFQATINDLLEQKDALAMGWHSQKQQLLQAVNTLSDQNCMLKETILTLQERIQQRERIQHMFGEIEARQQYLMMQDGLRHGQLRRRVAAPPQPEERDEVPQFSKTKGGIVHVEQ